MPPSKPHPRRIVRAHACSWPEPGIWSAALWRTWVKTPKLATVCEEARRIFAETGDRGELARALHSMAEVPLNQGDLATAGKLYRQSLAILREIGDQQGMGSELLNLGLIAVMQGDFAAGLKMYDESFRSYQEAGDKPGMAAVMGNTGNLLRAQGNWPTRSRITGKLWPFPMKWGTAVPSALSCRPSDSRWPTRATCGGASKMFQQALAIQRDIGEKSNYADTLRGMGRVLMQRGKPAQARKLLDQALATQQQARRNGKAPRRRVWRWRSSIAIPAAQARRNRSPGRPCRCFKAKRTERRDVRRRNSCLDRYSEQGKGKRPPRFWKPR
jgi:tetratricopeptide (TPR) repeat protein